MTQSNVSRIPFQNIVQNAVGATILRRTNPKAVLSHGWRAYECCVCKSKFDKALDARTCAEIDHVTGRHRP